MRARRLTVDVSCAAGDPGRDRRHRVHRVLVMARLTRHRSAAARRAQRQRVASGLARLRVGAVVVDAGAEAVDVGGRPHAEHLRVGRRARVDGEVEPVAVEAVVQQVGQRAQRAERGLLAERRRDEDEGRVARVRHRPAQRRDLRRRHRARQRAADVHGVGAQRAGDRVDPLVGARGRREDAERTHERHRQPDPARHRRRSYAGRDDQTSLVLSSRGRLAARGRPAPSARA